MTKFFLYKLSEVPGDLSAWMDHVVVNLFLAPPFICAKLAKKIGGIRVRIGKIGI